jgi:hypothetical protein
MAVFEYNEDRENEQQQGLYALAVGMSRKYLIEIACRDVEDDSHEYVAVGFVVEPVH